MPMIGSAGQAALAKYDPSQLSRADKLMMLGATMRDVGAALRGGQGESVLDTQGMLAARQMRAQQMGLMGKITGLMGGSAAAAPSPDASAAPPAAATLPSADAQPGAPPSANGQPGPAAAPPPAAAGPAGVGLSDPEMQRTIAAGSMLGVPGMKEITELLSQARPTVKLGPDGQPYDERSTASLGMHFKNPSNVNNTIVDLNDPTNVNRAIPSAPVPGAMPVYDNQGHVVDWSLPQGSARAIGAAKAAEIGSSEATKLPYVAPTARAQALGQTLGSPITVPNPNGSGTLMLGSDYFGGAGGPGGQPGGQPGGSPPAAAAPQPAGPAGAAIAAQTAAARQPGLGTSQSPADKALAEARAGIQAEREKLQPKEAASLRDLDSASALTSATIHQILGDQKDPKTGKWTPTGRSMVGPWTVSTMGAALAGVPGSPAHDVQQLLEHVNAATSMTNLQNLRDNSPTGAGLGRVTQTEIQLLAAMNGSTNQGQSEQQFKQNLRRQVDQLDAAVANRHRLFQDMHGQPSASGQASGSAGLAGMPLADRLAEARRRGLIR